VTKEHRTEGGRAHRWRFPGPFVWLRGLTIRRIAFGRLRTCESEAGNGPIGFARTPLTPRATLRFASCGASNHPRAPRRGHSAYRARIARPRVRAARPRMRAKAVYQSFRPQAASWVPARAAQPTYDEPRCCSMPQLPLPSRSAVPCLKQWPHRRSRLSRQSPPTQSQANDRLPIVLWPRAHLSTESHCRAPHDRGEWQDKSRGRPWAQTARTLSEKRGPRLRCAHTHAE
jgi:hypothetical protein